MLDLWSRFTLFLAFVELYGGSYNYYDVYCYHLFIIIFVRLGLMHGYFISLDVIRD